MSAPLHEEIRVVLGRGKLVRCEDTRYIVAGAQLVRWADAAQALAAKLAQAAPWVCPECGPHIRIDEDGCCVTCGRTAHDIRCIVGGCDKPATVAVDWVGPPTETWFKFCDEHDPRRAAP